VAPETLENPSTQPLPGWELSQLEQLGPGSPPSGALLVTLSSTSVMQPSRDREEAVGKIALSR
jgi:hypothetical protein